MKTMKITALIAIILFTAFFANAQTKYIVDTEKSTVVWLAKKVTGDHNGNVKISSGEFTISDNKVSTGKVVIDMTSITNNDMSDETYKAKLVNHLKSEDFFGVEKFPTATFETVKENKIMKGNTVLKGKITVKGITQPFEVKLTFVPSGDEMRIFANFTIDRTKFNIKYGSGAFFEDLGDKTIFDDFQITLNMVARKAK